MMVVGKKQALRPNRGCLFRRLAGCGTGVEKPYAAGIFGRPDPRMDLPASPVAWRPSQRAISSFSPGSHRSGNEIGLFRADGRRLAIACLRTRRQMNLC